MLSFVRLSTDNMAKTIFILLTFLVYSLSGVFCKYASFYEPLSWGYILCLGAVVSVLGVHAVLWQKLLSMMQLNKALLCKSITLFFGLLIANQLFDEQITINNILGAVIILSGLIVLSLKPSKQ